RSGHPASVSFPTRRSSDLPDDLRPYAAAGAAGELLPALSRAPPAQPSVEDSSTIRRHKRRLPAVRQGRLQGREALIWSARLGPRSEEHTSELQSRENLVCR